MTTWTSTVTINKRIILEGNGTSNTVIQRSRVAAGFLSNPMFHVTGVTGFEMRELTLDGTRDTDPNVYQDTGLYLQNCVDFRIHHMAFTDFAIAVASHGDPTVQRGLIDHNTFTDNFYTTGGGSLGYGVFTTGNGTYPALSLGTATNVFVEDNTFTRSRHNIASQNGSRYVFRYNTIVQDLGVSANAAAIDAHGVSSFPRGTRQYEVYHNTITDTVTQFSAIHPRGGDGVIFNNVMSPQSSDRDILLTVEDSGAGNGCSGSYPQPDQIRDLYIWGNTRHGGAAAQVKIDSGCSAYLQVNRDYFLTARPGYTPYQYPHPLQGAQSPEPDYTTGLRMHLKFDEGADTTAEDSTANNHDGTLGAGNSWGAAKLGTSAVTYDGTANGVVTVSGGLTNPTAATLAAWVFPTAWPTTTNGVVNIRDGIILRLQDSGSVRGSFYTGTAYSGITVAAGIPLNTWTHVAYTVTAGSQVVYVNGDAVGSATTATPVSYTGLPADTVVGSHPTVPANHRFQGLIDDVRVYTRALTATDIAGLADLLDPPPLSVQITTPTTNASHSTSTALLANMGGVASDNVGVTGVTWTCPTCSPTSGSANCTPACGAAATFVNWVIPSMNLPAPTGGATFTTSLITVTASDASGTKTDTLTVTYTPPPPVGTCTHYASTSGTGNGMTTGTPFQIANFWTAIAAAPAGKTLCLADGTYTGGNGMIQPPANLSGTASLPITIQAINDGLVLLDGQNARNPVVIGGTNQWYVVQGINARNGLTGVYQFVGSNNRGKRLVGWNATSGQANAVVFEVQGTNTIVEDCAGWGDNARTVFQGSGQATSTGSGYRRCWGEFNDHPEGGSIAAGATFRVGSGQRYENIIGTWNKTGQ
jgi:hypothetical protein